MLVVVVGFNVSSWETWGLGMDGQYWQGGDKKLWIVIRKNRGK